MGEHRRRIDKVLNPEFLVHLPEWPLEELRRRQAECLEIETEVSYVRRMTQARIDILEAELDRRASGGSVGDLIAAWPDSRTDPDKEQRVGVAVVAAADRLSAALGYRSVDSVREAPRARGGS